jgi:hypothetical protein
MSKPSVDQDRILVSTAEVDDGYEMEPVAKKWQGTDADQYDMSVLGRVQELRVSWSHMIFLNARAFRRITNSIFPSIDSCQRNFQFISILGFGCTLISTWEILLTYVLYLQYPRNRQESHA